MIHILYLSAATNPVGNQLLNALRNDHYTIVPTFLEQMSQDDLVSSRAADNFWKLLQLDPDSVTHQTYDEILIALTHLAGWDDLHAFLKDPITATAIPAYISDEQFKQFFDDIGYPGDYPTK